MPTYEKQNLKYGQLPAKVAEEIPRNKHIIDLIDLIDLKNSDIYVKMERNQIYPLKPLTWYVLLQDVLKEHNITITCDNNRGLSWNCVFNQTFWLTELAYDQEPEFIGHKFSKSLIEK